MMWKSVVSTLEMNEALSATSSEDDESSGSKSGQRVGFSSFMLTNLVTWSKRRSTKENTLLSTSKCTESSEPSANTSRTWEKKSASKSAAASSSASGTTQQQQQRARWRATS